ncbi:efflux transporter outer membrane subunit [Mitsuaria sp. GD03876]|uniref:efflux transporter outer membrane subunit n=1 Tax=Mitsuaria sp. GD03876 TaxID=2975399 RepID=UPI00244731A8|nr:efflux transporter outer membrane subunit [Mitsuaria sp. GD03876]MDH0867927.1 efflux transporter outer membrane subunit [Mitsuaria sp. GD03876]
MSRALKIAAWPLALGLSACGSLVPSTDAPRPPLREDFRPAAAAASASAPADAASSAAPSHEWRGFFADARLDEVVAIALDQNRNLRANAAVVERVRAQYRVTAADRLPEIGLSASATRQRASGGADATTTYGVNLGLASYEIDLFNRLGSLEGAALSRFLAEQENQRSARLSLAAEVATAWLGLAAAQQRLVLNQDLRDSQRRSFDLAERQYALGAASGLERARSRTAFESARGDAAESLTAVTQARLQLELLAGQPLPDRLLPVAQDAPQALALPAVPGGLPAEVLLQRPDLRAAEQRLRAAAFDVGAARAARFPRLTLTASAGTRSPDLDGLFKSGSGVWSLVPQIDLPLFDGGQRRAQVEVSEASRREAMANYEAALQSAFRDVADALAVRDQLAERLDAQQAQVEAAEQSLRLAERSYRLGGSSQLEVLDAQRQLTTARRLLVTLRQTEQVNRVALLRALGGRWTP